MTREQVKCPCCGADVESYSIELMKGIVTPLMAEIITVLQRQPGEYLSANFIADFAYRRCSEGGPEIPERAIVSAIGHNRRRLNALGWQVVSQLGRGGGYRLQTFPSMKPEDIARRGEGE